MCWLNTSEQSRTQANFCLLLWTEVVKFTTGVRQTFRALSFFEHTYPTADCLSRSFVIAGDHDDTDTGMSTLLYGITDFCARWIQHANDPDKCDAGLGRKTLAIKIKVNVCLWVSRETRPNGRRDFNQIWCADLGDPGAGRCGVVLSKIMPRSLGLL